MQAGGHVVGNLQLEREFLSVVGFVPKYRHGPKIGDHGSLDPTKVAESGILSVEDAVRMRTAGADAVLVGELLVRHGDPRAAVAALRAVA